MPQDGATTRSPRQFKIVGTRPLRPDGIDKVTGKARFGADMYMPGMLYGFVLRSPHAHARIKRIDAASALALDGVKAVLTSSDLPDHANGDQGLRDALENVMARSKALYDGHPVAAVAAVSPAIARQALKMIKVDYEVLPHVTDVEAAMAPDAPILHEHIFTEGVQPKAERPSNVACRHQFGHGDLDKGFKAADVVIERTFRTEAAHQGYIEPHACLADLKADGSGDIWCCTQGHYMVRTMCASLLGLDISRLRVTASEIGGGFGGKTVVFLEPLRSGAVAQGRPAGEDGDELRGGVSGQRPDRVERDARQDRYQEGWASYRRRCRAEVSGWRLSGFARRHGRHGGFRVLRARERARRRLRRRVQSTEARRLTGRQARRSPHSRSRA